MASHPRQNCSDGGVRFVYIVSPSLFIVFQQSLQLLPGEEYPALYSA